MRKLNQFCQRLGTFWATRDAHGMVRERQTVGSITAHSGLMWKSVEIRARKVLLLSHTQRKISLGICRTNITTDKTPEPGREQHSRCCTSDPRRSELCPGTHSLLRTAAVPPLQLPQTQFSSFQPTTKFPEKLWPLVPPGECVRGGTRTYQAAIGDLSMA